MKFQSTIFKSVWGISEKKHTESFAPPQIVGNPISGRILIPLPQLVAGGHLDSLEISWYNRQIS